MARNNYSVNLVDFKGDTGVQSLQATAGRVWQAEAERNSSTIVPREARLNRFCGPRASRAIQDTTYPGRVAQRARWRVLGASPAARRGTDARGCGGGAGVGVG